MTAEGKRACVIGAGFGGLALAIRLQSAGVATTLIEARDQPGGCAYHWRRDDFTFDAGPTMITDPASLRELWELTAHDIADDVELMPVSPFCRFSWPDGAVFDYSNDPRALRAEVARLDPADLAGYEEFMAYAAEVGREGYTAKPFLDLRSMIEAAPALIKHQAWRALYATIARFVGNEKLREALSFHALLIGGNPFTTSAIQAQAGKLEQDAGVWWARGGTNRLVAGMVRQFERLGGTLRLGDPVVQVHTLGTRATEVETQSGWRERFNAVASNADVIHTYRDLLRASSRGPQMARKLAKKRFSPSAFVVHFGIEGSWPGIPHHTVLFGPRYEGLLTDIYDHGVLPRDLMIYLHHPSVTDPSMAPEGKSAFSAMVPVAHLGKLAIDWEQVGPMLERRVLDEVARRLIPDLDDRLVTSFHYTPRDFALDLNAHLGSAFSLEPTLSQSAWFRVHNRDTVIANFYLVGAGTHPGAGIPGVVASAMATAGLMLEDLCR
uniref:phytoene desaturase n=1 Tax=Altererythrobacter segetis TaxID=1104773 RepID=UPI00140833B8|nr:phytoene desaturase [Altererythrobacter segetis]